MLKQDLRLKQLLKLSPQQIQLMKLVQLPTLAFEEAINQEIEENPALEKNSSDDVFDNEVLENNDDFDDQRDIINTSDINIDEYLSDDEFPSYKTTSNNYSDDDEVEMPYSQSETFYEHLIAQLHSFRLSKEEKEIVLFIIGNLDDDGYLRRDLSALIDDMAFTLGIFSDLKTVTRLLKTCVQTLDPIGVGARNLQECLLLQIKSKDLTYNILKNSFEEFTKKHYSKILQKYGINESQLKQSISEIEKLNPKPGKSFSNNSKNTEEIIPDFTISIVNGDLELVLNNRNEPELKISREYSEIFETYKNTEKKSKVQKDAVIFMKQKLDSAKWFIDAIKQRINTLYVTMKAIMDYQREYFLSGEEEKLRPMILKDISEITNLDISTISRVANSKYVSTPYGTMLIKNLFSESLTNSDGDEVSTKEIKKILSELVNNEDPRKPLTDDNLMKMLNDKGYNIARRTIAKYRDLLNIPVARLRKKI